MEAGVPRGRIHPLGGGDALIELRGEGLDVGREGEPGGLLEMPLVGRGVGAGEPGAGGAEEVVGFERGWEGERLIGGGGETVDTGFFLDFAEGGLE